MMMNSDDEMTVPVDSGTAEADTADDGAPATSVTWDGGGDDGRRTTSTCKFFVGLGMTGAQPDDAAEHDATEDHQQRQRRQGTEQADGHTANCACSPADNSDDVEHDEQVPEPTDCCNDEENPDLQEDPDVDRSPSKVVEVDQDTFPADEMCLDDDGDNPDDVMEQFCDAECDDLAYENEEGAGCDSVSDAVSLEANSDEVDGVGTEELAQSQSDSMLCRLPVRLDSVQELSDSAGEDVVTEQSVCVDALALSPSTTSPTSPSSVFDQALSDHRSPDSDSKPPTGAVVLRKSSSSRSDSWPQSPEYAIVQGHKVELRPSKMTTATKRVSSFRKSLIK